MTTYVKITDKDVCQPYCSNVRWLHIAWFRQVHDFLWQNVVDWMWSNHLTLENKKLIEIFILFSTIRCSIPLTTQRYPSNPFIHTLTAPWCYIRLRWYFVLNVLVSYLADTPLSQSVGDNFRVSDCNKYLSG